MQLMVPEVSSIHVDNLVHELNTVGYGCIPNYISPEQLARMRGFVGEALERSHSEYVHFNGPDSVAGSGLEELADSPEFRKLIYQVYELGTDRPAPIEPFYQVLRCLSGTSGQKNSLIFHYDSYVVTALIPIQIPTSGIAGDLLMYPNTRKVHSTYFRNAIDKVLLDNPLTQRVLKAATKSSRWNPQRIKMIPGNLYFFWGYRSIHTNEPCDPDKVRATALFHFANPHRKAQLS
jgi:hypothetical protein